MEQISSYGTTENPPRRWGTFRGSYKHRTQIGEAITPRLEAFHVIEIFWSIGLNMG